MEICEKILQRCDSMLGKIDEIERIGLEMKADMEQILNKMEHTEAREDKTEQTDSYKAQKAEIQVLLEMMGEPREKERVKMAADENKWRKSISDYFGKTGKETKRQANGAMKRKKETQTGPWEEDEELNEKQRKKPAKRLARENKDQKKGELWKGDGRCGGGRRRPGNGNLEMEKEE